MDNRIIDQLRTEAKKTLVHWANDRQRLFYDERCLGEIF